MYTMIAGVTPALVYTKQFLKQAGIPLTDSFRWDVKHLLLDVPSFRPGSLDPDTIMAALPQQAIIWGGNLDHPALEGYRCIDLLKDEEYLIRNAAITADCTLRLMESMSSIPLADRRILIIGWGRIGKSLASKLTALGCNVTVTIRRESDRAMAESAGYSSLHIDSIQTEICNYDTIINTAPAPVLKEADFDSCSSCLKIDLASVRGIAGDDVVWARGLPGKFAPEQSGQLIAETFLRILKEEKP